LAAARDPGSRAGHGPGGDLRVAEACDIVDCYESFRALAASGIITRRQSTRITKHSRPRDGRPTKSPKSYQDTWAIFTRPLTRLRWTSMDRATRSWVAY